MPLKLELPWSCVRQNFFFYFYSPTLEFVFKKVSSSSKLKKRILSKHLSFCTRSFYYKNINNMMTKKYIYSTDKKDNFKDKAIIQIQKQQCKCIKHYQYQ